MRRSTSLLASLPGAVAVSACSLFGVRSGYEAPGYEVVDTLADRVEVRRYDPRVVIETEVEAEEAGDARSRAFRILAAYIFGENQGSREVAMTVPVETRREPEKIAMTVPVETRDDAGRVRMRFFAPSEYTVDTLPAPRDPRVRLAEAPAETLAVLRFSGGTGESAVAERRRELLELLAGSAWRPDGEPRALFYDPPWTLPFLRRNEVAVPVQGRP